MPSSFLARILAALAVLAALEPGLATFSGATLTFGGPAMAQGDDDGGDDDGGDDDGGDDDGGDDDGGDDGAGDDGPGDDGPGDDGGNPGGGGSGSAVGGAGSGGSGGQARSRRGARSVGATRAPAVEAVLPTRASGEIVVSGLTDIDLAALLSDGFAIIETYSIVRNGPILHRLQVPEGVSLEEARDRVRARDSGRNADFNHYYRTGEAITPAGSASPVIARPVADCVHLNCATLAQIGWPEARPPNCRSTAAIGVIDTSVNLDHAGLARAKVELLRVADDDLPSSRDTHGTAVVSLLVGAEARAPGLLPEASIVAVDIFAREGGDERADVAHLVQALDLLAQRGVRVANLSLAGPENQVLTDMLAAVAESGMLVVAASGNAGPAAPPSWPAAAETALAVTAVDADSRIYRRAQRGPHLDLSAPGVEVWSAASVRGVKPRTGTSFATPFVTAAASILMSRAPEMTPQEAITALRVMAGDLGAAGADEVFGAGLIALGDLCSRPFP